jgi:uncharacterized protein (TIGR02265 family)
MVGVRDEKGTIVAAQSISLEDTDFTVPTFRANVDLEASLDRCPKWATTKGTFFTYLIDHVRDRLGSEPEGLYEGTKRSRWVPFAGYPLRDFMRLAHNAARLVHPKEPTQEGLRRMGWISYSSFAATMAGRVVLFALGDRLEDVIRTSPKAYALALPGASVEATRLRDGHYRYALRGAYSFVDCYHYGVLEGAVRAFGINATLRLRQLERAGDADFDVQWQAQSQRMPVATPAKPPGTRTP